MTIGIIGLGKVGGALGKRWTEAGHEVVYGVRDLSPERILAHVEGGGSGAQLVPISEAAASEVIVLAVPYSAVESVICLAGDLSGKVVLDCTDPFSSMGVKPGFSSAAEHIQQLVGTARVVKIFNTIGFESMAEPGYDGGMPTMLYAGDSTEAKKVAHLLAAEIGFEPIDSGKLNEAHLLEALACLWVALAEGRGLGTNIAFKLLMR